MVNDIVRYLLKGGRSLTNSVTYALEDRISALITKDPNKLKVYMGHIVFKLVIDGTVHYIRDDAVIDYDGETYTGKEFYDKYKETHSPF